MGASRAYKVTVFVDESCSHLDWDEVDAPQIDFETGENYTETFKVCNDCGQYQDADGFWHDWTR